MTLTNRQFVLHAVCVAGHCTHCAEKILAEVDSLDDPADVGRFLANMRERLAAIEGEAKPEVVVAPEVYRSRPGWPLHEAFVGLIQEAGRSITSDAVRAGVLGGGWERVTNWGYDLSLLMKRYEPYDEVPTLVGETWSVRGFAEVGAAIKEGVPECRLFLSTWHPSGK